QRLAEVGLAAADLREMLDRRDESGLQRLDRGPRSFEQGPGHAFVLPDQGKEKMLGLDRLVGAFARELRSFLHSLQRLLGEPLLSHHPWFSHCLAMAKRLHRILQACLSCPSWRRCGSGSGPGSRASRSCAISTFGTWAGSTG